MDHILSRWEWRTFGQDFAAAESRLASVAAEKVQQSEEIYLLSTLSDGNVKIRDQLLDIKRLEAVNADGLERWRPVLKEPFPLGASAALELNAALGLNSMAVEAEKLTLDALLERLAALSGPVHVVNVTKTRSRFHIQGCIAEHTVVIADGRKVRTVAVEDTDASKVVGAVRALGLDGYPNTSYPRGLLQVLGVSD
jgi:exopolyphosphatase/guanosine-5'-triphosphate,3'-diphosphate pyrophosphatase